MTVIVRKVARFLFSERTRIAVKFDIARIRAKVFGPRRQREPIILRMHLGSGSRRLQGWLNVDLAGADVNIDLTARPFPFPTDCFEVVVTQHLIEHLDLESEVIPVFREVCRVLNPGGELWLSTPDMAKLCAEYLRDGGKELHRYVMARDPFSFPEGFPEPFILNTSFFQRGLHKNLFDFELLDWTLLKCGFVGIQRVVEAELLKRFPDFPPRNDDYEALVIRCTKPTQT